MHEVGHRNRLSRLCPRKRRYPSPGPTLESSRDPSERGGRFDSAHEYPSRRGCGSRAAPPSWRATAIPSRSRIPVTSGSKSSWAWSSEYSDGTSRRWTHARSSAASLASTTFRTAHMPMNSALSRLSTPRPLARFSVRRTRFRTSPESDSGVTVTSRSMSLTTSSLPPLRN